MFVEQLNGLFSENHDVKVCVTQLPVLLLLWLLPVAVIIIITVAF